MWTNVIPGTFLVAILLVIIFNLVTPTEKELNDQDLFQGNFTQKVDKDKDVSE